MKKFKHLNYRIIPVGLKRCYVSVLPGPDWVQRYVHPFFDDPYSGYILYSRHHGEGLNGRGNRVDDYTLFDTEEQAELAIRKDMEARYKQFQEEEQRKMQLRMAPKRKRRKVPPFKYLETE